MNLSVCLSIILLFSYQDANKLHVLERLGLELQLLVSGLPALLAHAEPAKQLNDNRWRWRAPGGRPSRHRWWQRKRSSAPQTVQRYGQGKVCYFLLLIVEKLFFGKVGSMKEPFIF